VNLDERACDRIAILPLAQMGPDGSDSRLAPPTKRAAQRSPQLGAVSARCCEHTSADDRFPWYMSYVRGEAIPSLVGPGSYTTASLGRFNGAYVVGDLSSLNAAHLP
jgi:hypothetical protein